MAAEIDGTSKGLLGAFAIFTFGSGLASLVCGILLLIQHLGVTYNFGSINLFITSIVFIVVGGLLIITVLLGVFGALKDVSALRLITLGFLLISFVALGVVGGWSMTASKTSRLETSIDSEIKFLQENVANMTEEMKKQAEYLNKKFNCCIEYTTEASTEKSQSISCKKPNSTENNENTSESKDSCATSYFQTKSKYVLCLAILALACVGAVFLALLLYALVFQRARAGYTAVSRG